MRNQFIYTEEVNLPKIEENIPKGIDAVEARTIIKKNSLNVDMIIRTIMLDNEGLLVLMDDLHERWQDKPNLNKNGKRTLGREKDTFQSEIYLSKEDGIRLLELTDIETTNNE
jgi:hypothetical protein